MDKTAEFIENPADQEIIIIHADTEDDAKLLEAMIRERLPTLSKVKTVFIGPVIGAHAGPGTIARMFMGEERAIIINPV